MSVLGRVSMILKGISLFALFSVSGTVSVAAAQAPSPDGGTSVNATATTMESPSSAPPLAPKSPRRATNASAVKAKRAAPVPQIPSESASSTSEAQLREYEIRLNAHRRELLEREAELEAARRQISALRQPSPADPGHHAHARELERSESAAREEVARLQEKTRALEAELRSASAAQPPPLPAPTAPIAPTAPTASGDEALIVSLERELEQERENRVALETEIQRLASESRSPDQLQAVSQSLDGARAEILVLNHRLAEEQRAREALEVTIERVRQTAGVAPGSDWVERFQATMSERHEQAERLQEELHKANEAIVALKGQLESTVREGGAGPESAKLESEVEKLKEALRTARQANADLRAQAELASRLAELLYGQSR